jgi:UDP-N-acetylmuramate dehydrogenase
MMTAPEIPALRGELLHQEPLARYTTWRVGGPARAFYRPADAQDLALFLQGLAADEALLWLGLGSNLLIRDGGFPGTVIALQGGLADIHIEGERLRAGAGAACAKVARSAARAGLTGAAFLAGIPGTMGGALAMNAGAFGGETWERVVDVTTVDRTGRLRVRTPQDFRVDYREVSGPRDEWFVGVTLQLERGDVESEQARIRQLLDRRAATQPTGRPSAGSTFRNPPGDHAARLIEAAGLKGFRIGGAEVSPKHANFLINTGQASAADIEALIGHVQQVVEQRFGVRLQPEVHVVGVPA